MRERAGDGGPCSTTAASGLRIAAALVALLACSSAAAFLNPPPPSFPPHVGGQWGPVFAWPHIPMSMAHLPDGRILAFSANERNAYPYNGDEFTHASVWDPRTGEFRLVPHPGHDMFCSAIVTLENGETFVMGGHNGINSPWVSYFDFRHDRWHQLGSDEDLNRGRWYPTAVYMGSGQVFIAGGAGGGEHPELWTPGSGFTVLSGIDLSSTILSLGLIDGAGSWPLLQLHPNGTIFHHGATSTMNQLDPFGGLGGLGSLTSLGPHGFGWFPGQGVSVFYDAGKLLVAGGSVSAQDSSAVPNATRIDLAGAAPAITPTAPMNLPRVFLNEVLLPTGDVLVVGGNTTGWYFSDFNAVRSPEIWHPGSGVWTLQNPQNQARTYHSTALLLADGRVISGGGGMLGQPCEGTGAPGECGVDHWNAEIFSPAYLFDDDDSPAERPAIGAAPAVVRVGGTFTVHADPGLDGFSLIRMSGATHTMNTDQRFLRPTSTETAPGVYQLVLHPNENVLVPGYWMLFALADGVPSVAKTIQIVNDGTPRGPPLAGRHDEVGDEILFEIEVEDPDGESIVFSATGLPAGVTLSPTSGVVSGSLAAPGLFNVHVVASDGVESIALDFQWVVSSERSEVGRVTAAPGGAWATVALENAYHEPVVVMGPPGAAGANPVTVRVRHVASTSFEYRLEAWPYLGTPPASETLDYLVVEAGEYTIPGGGTLVAGIASEVDFAHPKSVAFSDEAFDATPTLLSQIVTDNAGAAARAQAPRLADVSTTGFALRIEEQARDDQRFPVEDVHWIAVEPMTLAGRLASAVEPTPIDATPTSIPFGTTFSAAPHLFAALQSTNGIEPVTLRRHAESASDATLAAQAEDSNGPAPDHAAETLGWLAIDPGTPSLMLLPLFNRPPTVVPPSSQSRIRGQAISLFVQAADPEGAALVFSAVGLPPGVAIDAATGEIAGAPTAAGTFIATVRVTDPSGGEDSAVFLWTVSDRLALSEMPTPPRIANGVVGYAARTNVPGDYLYRWEFGDGSPPTGPSSSPETSHVFVGPGRYVVTSTVEDPSSGLIDTRQFTQIVVAPPTASRPTSSSSIAYEAAHDRVWVVNPDSASVTVIDALARTRIAEIPVAAGPRTLAIAGDGRIWVACREASVVDIVDPGSLFVVQTIPLPRGGRPFGLVFDPAGTTAFVALEDGGAIVRLDGGTGAVLGSQSVGRHVRHLAVSADGSQLFATRFVTPPLPGEASGVPATEVEGRPIGGEVLRFDAATLTPGPTSILQASFAPDTERSARGIPNHLGAPVVSPDGGMLLVPSKQDNVLRGGFRDGLPLTHDSTVRAISSRIDLATGLEVAGARVDHDDASVASALIFDADGAHAFTALEGNRQLAIVDPQAHFELGRVDTGRAPRGLALSADGRTLFVDDFLDRSVSAYDLSRLTDYEDVALPRVATIATVAVEPLPADVLLGKRHFFDAADPRLARQRYVYCGACHADGGHDGRTWDFTQLGQGLRNTIDLAGHGRDQGPLHWTGNFDEVQDFETAIRAFGGAGFLTAAQLAATSDPLGASKAGLSPDLDALAAYVGSLTHAGASPERDPDGALTPDAQAGRSLFEAQRCARCHRGAGFTDSAPGLRHDVGTLGPGSGPQGAFDTPTLRGLWRSAPYLHDGRAPTLEDAIAAHDTSATSPEERALLAAYLLQIDDAETKAPDEAPVVVLAAPAAGGETRAGTLVALRATATDHEEGDLTAKIAWTSSLDGALGVGGSLDVADLSVGVHVLTATATDADGEAGQAETSHVVLVNHAPTVVLTSPAEGLTFTETKPIVLAATASDPDDGELSDAIVWTSSLTGPLGTGSTLTRTDLAPGVHVLTAFVTDAGGLPDSASVVVTVVVNAAPDVAILSPASGATRTLGFPVALRATASDRDDGDLSASLAWSSSLDGALGTGGSLDPSSLSAGVHVLTASVADALGLVGHAQVTLTMAVNTPPEIAILAPVIGATATQGRFVVLAATANDSEDGDLASGLVWHSSLDGALGTGATLQIASLSLGTHVLSASAIDQRGEVGRAEVLLTIVANAPPNVSITSPVDGLRRSVGVPIALSAHASDPEDGDVSSSLLWSSDLVGPLGSGPDLALAGLAVGTHVLTARATDALGLGTAVQVSLTIVDDGAPDVTITAPFDGRSYIGGDPIGLVATALDPEDGDLTPGLTWTSSLDGALGVGGTLTTSGLSLGHHLLTAAVVDALGRTGSATIGVTVHANQPPTVSVTYPPSFVAIGEQEPIALVAEVLDPEDGDLSLEVEWRSSLDGPLGRGSPLGVSGLSVGAHAITASVTDGRGAIASARIYVSVPEPGIFSGLAWGAVALLAARGAGRSSRCSRSRSRDAGDSAS